MLNCRVLRAGAADVETTASRSGCLPSGPSCDLARRQRSWLPSRTVSVSFLAGVSVLMRLTFVAMRALRPALARRARRRPSPRHVRAARCQSRRCARECGGCAAPAAIQADPAANPGVVVAIAEQHHRADGQVGSLLANCFRLSPMCVDGSSGCDPCGSIDRGSARRQPGKGASENASSRPASTPSLERRQRRSLARLAVLSAMPMLRESSTSTAMMFCCGSTRRP